MHIFHRILIGLGLTIGSMNMAQALDYLSMLGDVPAGRRLGGVARSGDCFR
jgi:hypothetical protein